MLIPVANHKITGSFLTIAVLMLLTCSDTVHGQAGTTTPSANVQEAFKDVPPVPNSQKSFEDVGAEPPDKPKDGQPALLPIEKMLMLAIENNPDVLVAKSKVSQAEAELNRARLQVTRQVFTLRESVQNQRAKVDKLRQQYNAGTAFAGDLGEELTKLAATEAELQYIVGQSPAILPNK